MTKQNRREPIDSRTVPKLNAEQDNRFRSYFAMVRGVSNPIWQPGKRGLSQAVQGMLPWW
jgi:hypothetical protein